MRYDLVVLGGGSAGLAAAVFGARMGARVALVEAGRLGGDRTWTGCVPSKALIHAASVSHAALASGWLGVGEIDFAAVMRGVRDAVQRVSETESPGSLRARGIEVVHGHGTFLGAGSVEADGLRLDARRFVVCTGAEPSPPPLPGLDSAPHMTYQTVFGLEELPRSLLVLGGGPLGCELAQAFGRLGSRVTVMERLDRLLPAVDPDASLIIEQRFRSEGIELVLGSAVEGVESDGAGVAVVVAGARRSGDALLIAAGRRPRVHGLGLEAIGVAVGPGGISVDTNLRTSMHHIYAAGDVTGGPQFTHYAAWQGYAAARNALFPGSVRGVRTPVPWAVFTDPEVAQVGLTEEEARASIRRVEVHRLPVELIDRAQAEGDVVGFVKVVTTGGDRLLGATIVSSGAADLANQLAGAIEGGLGLGSLARLLDIYPTRGYGLLQLASDARLEHTASSRGSRLLLRLSRRWG
jgi:pyruvate/2-oxoglutarate dehydrogenase complex dihydrolipoamide dehydrogenase (E3) component